MIGAELLLRERPLRAGPTTSGHLVVLASQGCAINRTPSPHSSKPTNTVASSATDLRSETTALAGKVSSGQPSAMLFMITWSSAMPACSRTHRRLHDALAVDHRAQAARPGGIDQRGGHRAAVERRVVAAVELAVVGDDHADRRVELPKAAQHPVLAHLLVVRVDAHGAEQLLGDADLALAVRALAKPGPIRNSRDCGTPATLRSVLPARMRSSGSPVTT